MSTERYSDLQPNLSPSPENLLVREENFISLRWKLLVPVFAVLLALAMIITYFVTSALTISGQTTQVSQLQLALQGTQSGMVERYQTLANEATRIAYLEGLSPAVATGDGVALRRLLEPELIAAGLDSVLVVNNDGQEVFGLRRDMANGDLSFATSVGSDLSVEPVVRAYLLEARPGAAQLMRSPTGFQVFVAQPILQDDMLRGQVLVGQGLTQVLADVRGSGLSQVALFDGAGGLLQTTYADPTGEMTSPLSLTPEQARQALNGAGTVPVAALQVRGYPYQVAYLPFVLGQDVLGVSGVYVPASVPYAVNLGRQLLSLSMAALAALVVIVAYVGVSRAVLRMEQVSGTARALATGDMGARTRMAAVDEIGEMGRSLDVYADLAQQRHDSLRTMLRRQRRENARLTAVFESMPDGIIVQDLDGRVLLMNEQARLLLGSQREFRRNFSRLTAVVTDVLGPALAPGIYAMGEPQRIPLAEKVLSAQAAAILTISDRRVGTVIVLRDITTQVKQEQAREDLLHTLAHDVQEPLMELAVLRSPVDLDPPMQRFAYEVMRNAVRLQRLILQIQDLSDLGPEQLEVGQQPVAVGALLGDLAAEWRSAAQAADLSLQVERLTIEMYVLGDERRLRWALGNLLDNAVKYTLPGGTIMLAAYRHSEGTGVIRVQDTGVGISPTDRAHIFTRFYRGTPRQPGGMILRVPGMGQGLFIARRVIEAHGGTLSVDSDGTTGVQATCVLPLTAPVAMTMPPVAVGADFSAARGGHEPAVLTGSRRNEPPA